MALTASPQSDTTTEPQATVFSLNNTPLLTKGRSDRAVARSEDMTNRIKVYAEGGENALHTHLYEDHVFLVLAGQATFYLGREERPQVVNKYEGVLLPKGAFYRFQSSGDENLVLFRSGAGKRRPDDRLGPDGRPLAGGSEENKHVPGEEAPGKVFSA
jgi:mannose-6-phosphate isomerase-like protein (cupin superfamily)